MSLGITVFAPRSLFCRRTGAFGMLFGTIALLTMSCPAHAETPSICSQAQQESQTNPDPELKSFAEVCALGQITCAFKNVQSSGTDQYQHAIDKCTDDLARDAAAKDPNSKLGRWIREHERTKDRSRQTDDDDCSDRNSDADSVIAACSDIIQRQSGSPRRLAEAYALRGQVYLSKHKFAAATADVNQAIRIDPNNARAYLTRGEAYGLAHDYEHAIADLTAAIKLSRDPNVLDLAFATRGYAYFAERRYDLAINDLDQALAIEPNDAQALYDRGLAKNRLGRTADGERDVMAARAIDPNIDK